MSRLLDVNVPSTFLLLDSHVTAADEYINVRDEQVARANNNILLASRIKRQIMTYTLPGNSMKYYGTDDHDSGNPMRLWHQTIAINQTTKRLRLYIRAYLTDLDAGSSLTQDVYLYPVISPVGAPRQYVPSTRITVDQAFSTYAESAAKTFTVIIPVNVVPSMSLWEGRRLVDFDIYMLGRLDTTNTLATGVTIDDVGYNWVKLSGAGSTVSTGEAIEINGQIRTCIEKSASLKIVDKPWSFSPAIIPGSDTATIREILGVHILSMSLFELPETTLMDTQGAMS